jgi:hypothetical protein
MVKHRESAANATKKIQAEALVEAAKMAKLLAQVRDYEKRMKKLAKEQK